MEHDSVKRVVFSGNAHMFSLVSQSVVTLWKSVDSLRMPCLTTLHTQCEQSIILPLYCQDASIEEGEGDPYGIQVKRVHLMGDREEC